MAHARVGCRADCISSNLVPIHDSNLDLLSSLLLRCPIIPLNGTRVWSSDITDYLNKNEDHRIRFDPELVPTPIGRGYSSAVHHSTSGELVPRSSARITGRADMRQKSYSLVIGLHSIWDSLKYLPIICLYDYVVIKPSQHLFSTYCIGKFKVGFELRHLQSVWMFPWLTLGVFLYA